MTPKQLLLAGICGCTAMDVVALLKKYKQELQSFTIDADAPTTSGKYPEIFEEVKLTFRLHGALDPGKVVEAVQLSQTKYCGVSAMVADTVPIRYEIWVNGTQAGEGRADFQ